MMSLTDLPILSEKGFEEAVRNYEQVERREQKEEDQVTLEELEKERVEALGGSREGEGDCGAGERCVRQDCRQAQ